MSILSPLFRAAYLENELGGAFDVRVPEMPKPHASEDDAWMGAGEELLVDLPPDGILVQEKPVPGWV